MWSSLIDSRGLVRASIFYKAAFYDRKAHFHTTARFTIGRVYRRGDNYNTLHGRHNKVKDNGLGRVVFVDTLVGCQKYISVLPTDDSIWDSEFDLPEVFDFPEVTGS